MQLRAMLGRNLLGLAAIVCGCLGGCAAKQMSSLPDSTARAAVDAPEHFITDAPSESLEPGLVGGCHNPLIDPRDGTRLTLIRSADGRGDYEPQPLRYGLKEGELLRVECASGRPMGIVRR